MSINDDWSFLGELDFSLTEGSAVGGKLAKFSEVDLGFDYRPVSNSKLNMLGMYSYLYDLDPLQQFGSLALDERSHVLSLEGLYEVTKRWEIGGKLAWKLAAVRMKRDAGNFFRSTTTLGIIRARYHYLKNWDSLVEYRVLDVSEAQDQRRGFLASIERHLGKHVKVGSGYNFTDFNDDLTALDYEAKGWFVNIVGKY